MSNPVSIHVAVMVYGPWDEANRKRRILLQRITEDGEIVALGEPASPVEMRGDFEVGRPPG